MDPNGFDDLLANTVSIQAKAPPLLPSCELVTAGSLSPCSLVIFGASGDLTERKLLPALFNLFLNGVLPSAFTITGCSRTEYTEDQFRDKLAQACSENCPSSREKWHEFARHLHYHAVDYTSDESYRNLRDFLHDLDTRSGTDGNRIFYLAVPPTLYPVIATRIGAAGLSRQIPERNGWSRIVVEKPFGRDLKSALELDRILHTGFEEEQIFRIDHYLAKETIQNILMLRFANAIFEPLWNRSYIDYVGMLTAEKLGVEHRAGYYEQAGVLRDMFQNHMLQLLALTALEPPSYFGAARVQDEKVKVFRSLKPFDLENVNDNLVLGQYAEGSIDKRDVVAYRQEPGVDRQSLTPTFAMLRLFVDNWRWRGVPFYLASGKRLAKKSTRIVVQFRKVPHSMFRNVLEENIAANRLVMGVHPDEEITLSFQTKNPGAKDCLRTVTMDFKYYDGYEGPTLDAYEKVLLDCIQGDHMLFWRQDGIELSWSFLTPILEKCESCLAGGSPLHFYPSGSWGPDAALPVMKMIL